MKILVADDHFLIRQFVKRTLNDNGFLDVDLVNDGNEAIEAIGHTISEPPLYDLIFLDWNMPGLTGIDALAYIRSKPEYQNAAIIMFTAESEKANIMKAVKMGATSYILKPISPADLTKKVREVMEWLRKRNVAHI